MPCRLRSIKSVVTPSGEVSGGILKEEASTCSASQGAWVRAQYSTSFPWLCQSGSSHRRRRDFLEPQEASAALLSQKMSLLSTAKQLSPYKMSPQHTTGGPDYKTSFVVYLLQLLCCWSCLHSLIHRDATPEIAEPVDEEIGWITAD